MYNLKKFFLLLINYTVLPLYDLINLAFVLKMLLILNIFLMYKSTKVLVKSIYLYYFLFLSVFVMFYFDITAYFGFLVFIETTAILILCIVSIVSFNQSIYNKKYNYIFFLYLLLLLFPSKYINFYDHYYNYIDFINHWDSNDYSGLFCFLYILNLFTTTVFYLYFISMFFYIFFFYLNYSQMKKITLNFFKSQNKRVDKKKNSSINKFK